MAVDYGLAGHVAIVTGSTSGIGRALAGALAEQGVNVILNGLGDPAAIEADRRDLQARTNAAIRYHAAAMTKPDEIADLIDYAVREFGRTDILVNTAGIISDRMVFSMGEADWDDVVGVHLKGHFCPTRHAAAHWRARAKAGEEVDARIINTASPSGLYGNVGQANYGAAKAGIAGFTLVCALELGRIGVTANCLAPTAITRLVAPLMGGEENISEDVRARLSPRWVATVAAWLASPEARHVTGRVFDVRGDTIAVAEGWHRGPEATNPGDPVGAGEVIEELLRSARANGDLDGRDAPDRF